ncbi:MAG: DUF268 domain-containing protein [Candidatus Omnitrophica bacterium]|nr:DUF268 domain-containing protein [Candidatus Omnitrophota bacterium]MDD5553097.1 DUF268 domain-containing protein [Candidatus Omnitrophota bacterium]
MNGKIKVRYQYRDDSYPPDKPLVYTKESVDSYLTAIKRKRSFYYGLTDFLLYRALKKYSITGKTVAIMGSTTPLYESICLAHAGKPTTIEYNKIISEDGRIKTMTVAEYEQGPLKFDTAFSISSFEHDGLGRYGERLNPEGDMDAMKRMKSILKPEGILFLSIPLGMDSLVWNMHRTYGRTRLRKLLEGWKLLDFFDFNPMQIILKRINCDPVFVLENSDQHKMREKWLIGYSIRFIKGILRENVAERLCR